MTSATRHEDLELAQDGEAGRAGSLAGRPPGLRSVGGGFRHRITILTFSAILGRQCLARRPADVAADRLSGCTGSGWRIPPLRFMTILPFAGFPCRRRPRLPRPRASAPAAAANAWPAGRRPPAAPPRPSIRNNQAIAGGQGDEGVGAGLDVTNQVGVQNEGFSSQFGQFDHADLHISRCCKREQVLV